MKKSAEIPAIPTDIQAAIACVLEYMYDDEQEHYEDTAEEDEENEDQEGAADHIFLSLQTLAKWVGWEAE